MTFNQISKNLQLCALAFTVCGILSPTVFAQGPNLDSPSHAPGIDAPKPVIEATPPAALAPVMVPPFNGDSHKFWDTRNRVLFIAAAAMNGADFAVTRANLQSGGQELNPMVRVFGSSTAGLAVNFIGETAGVVGLSYFFHKTGHHKMERAVSIINIGSSAGAVGYGLAHR